MDFIVGGSGIIVVGIFIDAAIVVAVVVAIVVAIVVVVVDAFVQTWSMWYHQGRWVLINSI